MSHSPLARRILRRGTELALVSALVAELAPGQSAGETTLSPVPAPGLAFARAQDGGTHEIWVTGARDGAATRVLTGVTFLPVRVVGHPIKDRLRLDRPASVGVGSGAPRVRLPGGGSVYRIARGGWTSLLLLREARSPRLLLSLPDADGQPAIPPTIHLTADGRRLGLATPLSAGGDLYVIDLTGAHETSCLTEDSPPLSIDGTSVRVGAEAAWFVADGTLYRTVGEGDVEPVLLGEHPVAPELAAARSADLVVALLEKPGGKRRLFRVPGEGPWSSVTDSFEHYSLPNYDHPLGPWLVVSPDGSIVAYREEDGGKHDLLVSRAAMPDEPLGVTIGSEFPGYVDDIGVVAFGQAELLCFFAGDLKKSGVVSDEEIGASDMYAADLSGEEGFVLRNVTRTNSQKRPPFDRLAEIFFVEAMVGPDARQILLVDRRGPGTTGLSCFQVDGAVELRNNHAVLLDEIDGDPTLVPTTMGTLVLAARTEGAPPSLVSCEEEGAAGPAVVRIRASNKSRHDDDGAKVWFDGKVEWGASYRIDAASAGEERLDGHTYLHVIGLDGTLIQECEIDTSCDAPLLLGDRFGASSVVAIEGEGGPAQGAYDYCAYDARPEVLFMTYTGEDCGVTVHGQAPDKVSCTGDPGFASPVRILATNKEDPFDDGAKVWFSDIVDLGGMFAVDAVHAGKNRLESTTFVHVLGLDDAVLQTVEFHTSCSQPLRAGERFGAADLDGCVLERGPSPGDGCAAGRPVMLTMQYTGDPCGTRSFGPRPYWLSPTDSMLRPLDMGPGSEGSLAAGTVIDRFAASSTGTHAAFVATDPDGIETLYLLDVEAGTLSRALDEEAYSSTLGYSADGRLGVGTSTGSRHRLLLLDAPFSAVDSGIPGPGFPLPH